MTRPHLARSRGALPAVLVVLALAVTGCGGTPKAKASASPSPSSSPTALPTGEVKVPPGVTLTKAGAVLPFGQSALVAYQANTQRNSVLQLTVSGVAQGQLKDFAAYQLGGDTLKSTFYYARVTVKNAGTGDLSRTDIPLYAVDASNALIQPTSFNNTFARCPSQPLPAGFTAGKQITTCLVYVVPPGQKLQSISYRPLQTFEPILWKGTVTPPPTTQNTTPRDKKSKKKRG